MCVTNIYVDRYPDGQTLTFRQTTTCQYGSPGRPCPASSTTENPVRKINWSEPTTEHMFTRSFHPRTQPQTPPRSPSGSHNRHSSSESGTHHRRHSRRLSPPRPISNRVHRKERIVIVDSPPTPRTPPLHHSQTFTAPSSPATPTFRTQERERGRPIIVDERPLRHRVPSIGAVVSDRPSSHHSRSQSRSRHVMWDSPSSSHTSFNSRLRREAEETERAHARELEHQVRLKLEATLKRERETRERDAEAGRRKAAWIKAQDEDIMSRPVVPLTPPRRERTRVPTITVVDQADMLPVMMGGLGIHDERIVKRTESDSEEAMKRRLRERQLPKRRFSVGPGYRRHRVAYDDGLYRWE